MAKSLYQSVSATLSGEIRKDKNARLIRTGSKYRLPEWDDGILELAEEVASIPVLPPRSEEKK